MTTAFDPVEPSPWWYCPQCATQVAAEDEDAILWHECANPYDRLRVFVALRKSQPNTDKDLMHVATQGRGGVLRLADIEALLDENDDLATWSH